MPKEKNSAASAIWPAVSAARGTSIIVPISVTSTPLSADHLGDDLLGLGADRLQLLHGADQRDHDLRLRVAARPSGAATAASAIARTCMANRPGMTRPSRTPRRPSIGFCSCIRRTAASSAGRPRRRPRRAPRRRATLHRRARSSGGRNSCSGGSISRTVTGRPSIAAKISTKSSRCSGSSASSAAVALVVGVGQDQPLDQLPPVAEEHVLGAAQADALRRRTGGPARRPRRCRRWSAPPAAACASACVMIRCTAATSGSSTCSRVEAALEVLHHRRTARPAPRRGRPCRWCRRWR